MKSGRVAARAPAARRNETRSTRTRPLFDPVCANSKN